LKFDKTVIEQAVDAAEQTAEYQPKPDNREWFHEEWKITTDVTYTAYKKWTDRQTRVKGLEHKGLWKIAHKIYNNKGIQTTV